VAAAREGFGLVVDGIEGLPSWNSTVFRLTTPTGSYALRMHGRGGRLVADIRRELALLRHLGRRGLRVPGPVAARTGEDLFSDGSPRHYDVTSWLDGNVRRRDLHPDDARPLGDTLARIHDASRSFDPAGAGEPSSVGDPAWLLSAATADDVESIASWFSAADRAVLAEVVDAVGPTLATLDEHEVESGLLHKDFILGNCVWHPNGLGVLDFADAGTGPFLYDLAPMLTNIGHEPALRTAFLAGYRSRLPLSAAQERALPLMEAVRHVSFCFRNIAKATRGVTTPPLDVHLPARIAEIRLLLPLWPS
jgi:Ser/Thr protein kinase RdoA (MazF antagonist)